MKLALSLRRCLCAMLALWLPLCAIAAQASGRCVHSQWLAMVEAKAYAQNETTQVVMPKAHCHEEATSADVQPREPAPTDCSHCDSCALAHGLPMKAAALSIDLPQAPRAAVAPAAFSSVAIHPLDRPPRPA
jgi:hypothetical protein